MRREANMNSQLESRLWGGKNRDTKLHDQNGEGKNTAARVRGGC